VLIRIKDKAFQLRILDKMEEMVAVENLQRIIWPDNETDVVPGHILITFAHNGGVVIGAFPISDEEAHTRDENINSETSFELATPPPSSMVGFVFGFPGLYQVNDNWKLKHCSHQLGVHPDYRDQGLGYFLKRAQWQMVRKQGIKLITWTYDPLQSRNANLNISHLGAVCNTYLRDAYGEMRDGLNVGLSSDRFQVDWWVDSHRVKDRLSRASRPKLDLAHYLAAGAEIINPSINTPTGIPTPNPNHFPKDFFKKLDQGNKPALVLVEIPADINRIKDLDLSIAQKWRSQTRYIFEELFLADYLVSDFIYLAGKFPRSFYVLTHGEETL